MKKKIAITVFSILFVAGLAGTFWGPSIADAASGLWNSCTRGKVNDVYPGDCHDYIDTNRDNICDRSQSDPRFSSTSEVAASSLPTDSLPPIIDSGDGTSTGSGDTNSATTTGNSHSYNLIPICVIVIVLYGITWILSTRKIIKDIVHRRIWNVVLLISLVVSVLLGLIRMLSIDFNIDISLPFNALFWHVEASIVLGIVALFHIFWHWRYFTIMPGKARNRNS